MPKKLLSQVMAGVCRGPRMFQLCRIWLEHGRYGRHVLRTAGRAEKRFPEWHSSMAWNILTVLFWIIPLVGSFHFKGWAPRLWSLSFFFMWGPKCLFQGTTASIRWLIIVYKIALSIKWYWQPHSGQWIIWHRMDGSSLVFLQRKFQREHTCTLSISINLQLYTVLRFVFGG